MSAPVPEDKGGNNMPLGHWWETVAAVASFGAGLIAFLRGLQAAKHAPAPAHDDYQSRLARCEEKVAMLEDAVLDQARWMLKHPGESGSSSRIGAPTER